MKNTKNILIIGVGGTGSGAADMFFKKQQALGNQTGNNVTALVLDTDAGDIASIKSATPISMADTASVGTICDRIGKNYLRGWFPCDDKAVRSQEMIRGASQWRKKSYLAFLNLMNKQDVRTAFISALEHMTVDPNASCEVYVVASLAGGTGSGSFIPIALYVKRYLRKVLGKAPMVKALLAMPDIFAKGQTPENRVKIYANAYAILREINAINLVANNYNEGRTASKKAPIRFRIGDPDEPNVGLLFDASDRAFWTPDAAPFSQIFLLDKVPLLDSVEAHNMILANSLYAMLATPIGTSIDSELSNHAVVQSQNNGSNAVYAGVSTSQISFPKDTVLDYLAHKKALDSCENEWMYLFKETEAKIDELRRQEKEIGRKFILKDGQYAHFFQSAVEDLFDANKIDLIEMIERGTTTTDETGTKRVQIIDKYWENVEQFIESKLNSVEMPKLDDPTEESVDKKKITHDEVVSAAEDQKKKMQDYFEKCVQAIRAAKTPTADSIINFNLEKGTTGDYSVVTNLLRVKGGKFIHPVSAMLQLSKLETKLVEALNGWKESDGWKELKERGAIKLPEKFLYLPDSTDVSSVDDIRGKCAYLNADEAKRRFVELLDSEGETVKSNHYKDLVAEYNDAKALLAQIKDKSLDELKHQVLFIVLQRVVRLREKYHTFFARFEKEKENLKEATNVAYHRDDGIVNGVINVYSTLEDKDVICEKVFKECGSETVAEVEESDNVAGKGVFDACFKAAIAQEEKDKHWNEKDAAPFRSLFDELVSSYKKYIEKSDAFEAIASYSVIQAIYESCVGNGDFKDVVRKHLSTANEIATPNLQLDRTSELPGLVEPADLSVFMISKETGRYIKQNAEKLGIPLCADIPDEDKCIKACAETFIHTYGNPTARVCIVPKMNDQILYCLGGIMDITPVRLDKINEMRVDERSYFKQYRESLKNFKRYDSDMWNPHLGDGWHKRGFLPFLNEEYEEQCDHTMVRALFYAFDKDIITFAKKDGLDKFEFYFKEDGNVTPMFTPEGFRIGRTNIAQIMAWLREHDEDELKQWSEGFKTGIKTYCDQLISVSGESDISTLEKQLTGTPFIKQLTGGLYADKEKYVDKDDEMTGPGIIPLAFMIKNSEESDRDCDDAERLLKVADEEFKKLCMSRVTPAEKPSLFAKVYNHELDVLYTQLAKASVYLMRKGSGDADGFKNFFDSLVNWVNGAGYFLAIPEDHIFNERNRNEVQIIAPYDFKANKAIMDILTCKEKKFVDTTDSDTESATYSTETEELDLTTPKD